MVNKLSLAVAALLITFALIVPGNTKHLPSVGLIFSMDYEVAPFINFLGLVEVNRSKGVLNNPLLPTKIYEAIHNNVHYKAAYAGYDRFFPSDQIQNIGPENALMNTLVLLDNFDPDVIISAGTAGGWSDRFHVNDVVACANGQTFPYWDRYINKSAEYEAYGNGEYPCANISQSLLDSYNISLARVGSGSSYVPDAQAQIFIENTNLDMIEMEGAAEAYVSQLLQIPFLAFKVVSNSYAYKNESVPLAVVCENLANKTIAVVESGEFFTYLDI